VNIICLGLLSEFYFDLDDFGFATDELLLKAYGDVGLAALGEVGRLAPPAP
jgi:hypothetical protein